MKMMVSALFATFLLLLSGCSGALFGLIKDKKAFDIDKYDYNGDPVGISCVYDENQTGFHQVQFNGTSEIPADLIQCLSNGKPLSLYFDGIASRLTANGSTFKFAREWLIASESNICYITYAYEQMPKGIVEVFVHARDMVKSHRLQFTAKLARDLVLNLREQCLQDETPGCLKDMSQVTMLGFSFGAHIASQTCRNLYKSTGQKVGKLIGFDPAGIALTLKRFNQAFIRRGDASYVQIIHTDIKAGTILQTGDVDIIVDCPVSIFNKHVFAVYMHMATAMKKLLLIAEKDELFRSGSGRIVPIYPYFPEGDRVPRENGVLIGVYSELDESKRGQSYKISFQDFRVDTLRRSIAHVVKAKM